MTTLSSESLSGLIPALIAAQAEFKPAVKDARNTHYGSAYLTLGATLDAILPALNANGLALVQHVAEREDGSTVLVTRLYHAQGEWLSSEYPILPTRNDPQGYGSALTYARRYAAMALVGLAAEDDDADAACGAKDALPRPPVRTTRQTPSVAHMAHSPAMPSPVDAAELADAVDNACTLGQLELLVPALRAVPKEMRPPLRRRYSERRERLSDGLPAVEQTHGASEAPASQPALETPGNSPGGRV